MRTYHDLKAAGICPRCKQKTDKEHTYCEKCREYMKEYQKKHMDRQLERSGRRYKRLRAEGRCVICRAPSGEKCMCERHRKIYNERRAKKRDEEAVGHRVGWNADVHGEKH